MFADLLPLSRLSNWSARLANTIVHAVCVKLKAPPQIITVVDVIVETLVFCLIQVVHHDDIDSSDKFWGDGKHRLFRRVVCYLGLPVQLRPS